MLFLTRTRMSAACQVRRCYDGRRWIQPFVVLRSNRPLHLLQQPPLGQMSTRGAERLVPAKAIGSSRAVANWRPHGEFAIGAFQFGLSITVGTENFALLAT
jgi:hypothetical protein